MASSRLERCVGALGLTGPGSAGTFYGELEGFPLQLAAGLPDRTTDVLALIRFDADGRAEDVAKALTESPDLPALGVGPDDLSSDADSVVLKFSPTVLISERKAQDVEQRVRAVVEVLKRAVPDNRKVCRKCGASRGEPALLEGEVDRFCVDCIESFEHQTQVAESAYAAHRVNVPLGVAASVLAGAAGAAAYGGVMIGTGRMLWLVTILTGSCVGWAAVMGAGKATAAVQAMAAATTIISVLAGLLMYVGYLVNKDAHAHGQAVDWVAFLLAAPKVLVATKYDGLFSLAGGLVGARYAIRRIRRPDFMIVEKPS